MRMLLTGNALFALVFAVGFLLAPGWMLAHYGAAANPELMQMCRFFGAAMLGFAALAWMARNADRGGRRAIVCGLIISFVAGLIVSVQGQLSGVVGSFGWLTVGLYLFFAVGYTYLEFLAKDAQGG